MANSKYKFISDAGHGWLEVKLSELRNLGIDHMISDYSYVRGNTAYLEEDCDAGLFIKASQIDTDTQIVDEHFDGDWIGRTYDRFEVTS